MIPLVLVHGFLGSAAQWDGLAGELGQERAVIALDLPGFGANAHLPPETRIEGFADWVIATLRERDVARYHLLGHSMGGMIAQEIARKDADKLEKLILYGTGPLGDIPGRFETMAESRRRAEEDGAATTAARISATWLLERDACPTYSTVAEHAALAGLPAILSALEAMEAWSGAHTLPQIDCDTLIIWGEHDRSYSWSQTEALWRGVTSSSLCVLPGCAHLAHLEVPELFNAAIHRFLSD
ncbi:MAG: alpha/beta fold hydrolase [Pseudomonadota bacterium]